MAEGFRVFTDDVNKFQISIPLGEYILPVNWHILIQTRLVEFNKALMNALVFDYGDWQVGAGEPSGFKSVTAFYPEEGFSSSGYSLSL